MLNEGDVVFNFERNGGYGGVDRPKVFSNINSGRQRERRTHSEYTGSPLRVAETVTENTTLKQKDGCVELKYDFKEKEDWHWLSSIELTKVSFDMEAGVLRYKHEDQRTSGKNLRWKLAEFIGERMFPGMKADADYDKDCLYVKADVNVEDDGVEACKIDLAPQNNDDRGP